VPISEVRNLRYVPGTSKGKSYMPGSIRFESGSKTWSFGSGMSDAEGLALIEQMLTVYAFPKDRALEYMDLSR